MEPEKKGVRGFVKEWTDEKPLAAFGLKVGVVAAVGIVAAPVVLGAACFKAACFKAAGFGAGGVIAGFVAAKVQGTIAWLAGFPVAAKGKGNVCLKK